MLTKKIKYCFIFLGLILQVHPLESASREPYQLSATASVSGRQQSLAHWNLQDLTRLKKTGSRERDPLTGKMVNWEGVLVSQLIDKALEGLSVEDRAQVDLVILKNEAGESAVIPRALIHKYSFLFAFHWSPSRLDAEGKERGAVYTVVPWTSQARILNEDIPWENAFISQPTTIELTNSQDRYRPFFLKRKTDPLALRGQHLFLRKCVACHLSDQDPVRSKIVSQILEQGMTEEGHPAIRRSSIRLSERDLKSLQKYMESYRKENSTHIPSVTADSRIPHLLSNPN